MVGSREGVCVFGHVHHVALTVPNQARTQERYTRVLGWQRLWSGDAAPTEVAVGAGVRLARRSCVCPSCRGLRRTTSSRRLPRPALQCRSRRAQGAGRTPRQEIAPRSRGAELKPLMPPESTGRSRTSVANGHRGPPARVDPPSDPSVAIWGANSTSKDSSKLCRKLPINPYITRSRSVEASQPSLLPYLGAGPWRCERKRLRSKMLASSVPCSA
jgi:hypothetical protein